MAQNGVGGKNKGKDVTLKKESEKQMIGYTRARDKVLKDEDGLKGDLAISERSNAAKSEKRKRRLGCGNRDVTQGKVAKNGRIVDQKATGEKSAAKEKGTVVSVGSGRGKSAGKRNIVPEEESAEMARASAKRRQVAEKEMVESSASPTEIRSYSLRIRRGLPSFRKVNVSESNFDQVVGKRVKVYWSGSRNWFTGKIKLYDSKKKHHKVLYDDGDMEELDLKRQRFELEVMPGEAFTLSSKHEPSVGKKEMDVDCGLANVGSVEESSLRVGDEDTLNKYSKPTRKVTGKAATDENAANGRTPARTRENADMDLAESCMLSSERGSYSLREKRGVPSFQKVNVSESNFNKIIGKRVKVYWSGSREWFTGKIELYDSKKKHHEVLYDDGDMEELDLKTQRFELEVMPGEAFTLSSKCEPNAGKIEMDVDRGLANVEGVEEGSLRVGDDDSLNKYSKPTRKVTGKAVKEDNAAKGITLARRRKNVDIDLAESCGLSPEGVSYSLRERRGVPSFQKVNVSESSFDQVVGKRVKVYWSGSRKWFTGLIKSYDTKKKCHRVLYDDSDMEELDLKTQRFELEVMPGEVFTLSSKCEPNAGKNQKDENCGYANMQSVKKSLLRAGDDEPLKKSSRPTRKVEAKAVEEGSKSQKKMATEVTKEKGSKSQKSATTKDDKMADSHKSISKAVSDPQAEVLQKKDGGQVNAESRKNPIRKGHAHGKTKRSLTM